MGFVGDFIGDVVGGVTGSKDQAAAAGKAGDQQYAATIKGIEEQRRQFDKLVELMAPYVSAGTGAMGAQQNLLGLKGQGAQTSAINALNNSPQMRAMLQQGENAILQNASATGGLRGGNTQGALGQFRPQLLNQLIQQQFANLGGLTQMGQASAAGQASAGMQTGANIGNLLQQGGAAQAGATMAKGGANRQAFGDLLGIGGMLSGFF